MTAADLVVALRHRGWKVATAESLTAGLVCSAIADVPGCSDVLLGGVVAYRPEVKQGLLGVDSLEPGLVSREVAEAMARGVCRRLGADVGIATTGAAGPESHDGAPVGSVWIAISTPLGVSCAHLDLEGVRASIRSQAAESAVTLALQAVAGADLREYAPE